jgi:cytochrome b
MPAQRTVSVWDLVVRIFHWTVAILVPLNYWWLEGGESPHQCVGYVIAALLAARIVWGFVGSRNARFANFLPTPARLRRHVQQLRTRRFDIGEGHNPLGALMILLLLSLLLIIVTSGWMQGLDRFWGEDWLQQLHKYAANALMFSVVLHLAGVIAMSRFTRLRLVRTMITGKRFISSDAAIDSSK